MKFTHFFVDRPIFASVLSIILVIVGYISYIALPVAQYPEIAPPTITVRATYPGANAETVAATVATPIEQEINGVEDMLYMSSYSASDGSMTLTITFKIGTDLDQANVLVQNRVAVAEPRLPQEVRQLGVVTRKASSDFLMIVNIQSPDNTFDQLYLSNYALMRVRDSLLRLDGVGDIQVFGAREYSLRVWLDPNRLASYGLTAGDVVAALQEQNVQVSGGALGAPPLTADAKAAFQLTVQTQGRFSNVSQFNNIIVKAGEAGRLVRLSDVARTELAARDYTTSSYLNGKETVAIGVFQRPGTNALQASNDVIARMEELKKDFPKGMDYAIVYNPTNYIQASVNEVYKTLFEAVVLVVIVVLVFLQSWRTAIIPIIAIPVSLIGTFAMMAAFGFSLNTLTLFGLVLAIGIVVDDAIVVVENVERNISLGLSPRDAAHRTMDEVGSALIAIALVLSAVFIPTAFIPGISGRFYQQFALTIAASTIISAFNSLTLSPALCALLLKAHDPHHRSRNPLVRVGSWLGNKFNRGFDRTSNGYARTVKGIVGHKLVLLVALCVYGGLIAATVHASRIVPTGFIPAQDQGYLIMVIQLPPGASLDRTDAVVQKATQIALDVPGVANVIGVPGIDGSTFTVSSNSAVVFTPLDPFEERLAKGQTANSIAGILVGRLQAIQEAFTIAVPPPPVQGLGNAGGFKMQLEDRNGVGVRQVLAAAGDIIARANQDPNLVRVFTTFGANTPQVYIDIDRTKARMLDVPVSNIFEALQVNLGSVYVNDFNAFGRIYQVRAQADARFRIETDQISRLQVRNGSGGLVPLGSLVEVSNVAGPNLIQRYNMYTSVPIQGDTAPAVSSGAGIAAMERIAGELLPPGISYEWTDIAFQEQQAGNTAIFIFALAVLFVFLVLAAQYESWTLPLAIVLIVPLAVLSALVGVMLRGMDNNILTQIGFVVLVGLAAKNAILIVEFARQSENHGNGPVAAVVEACRLRLRPILMTAFAFILGVIPLAIAQGPGAEMRQALGTAVVFGMTGVTFFGLFLTPVFYVVLRSLSLWLRPARNTVSEEPTASTHA
ncbi:MAG: efflux RND transporter permease subunit [Chelatococcus sp.]|jgi:HAE1 family hydrophobic/amphiphilic exporter-1|uniref:efflux RND transporter permease subunit n=1 Tax=unclassified Chelatococcus TaxID=2638111 RepID=UPI001BCE0CAB|nr:MULTISPECIES: multidrug efflux RND transporter permease subunit [unclassified Chelatococcus]CAH1667206.1 Efflux pump membrane transporter BepG [Hyphomicrobiales bacterium]MBS7737997.1 efflux RND transporter permease subunit [Chelatococcus sp. HY11]MBX3536123.1 efflux RND transporter permease subunit [Chelatococcus sp.]MBX3546364.1 efflux RND transporter permease subunit [Chelatococcus sp.]MCO5077658.1 efflux RND transporter permease subunit [Chelatococcus sp.]